MRQLVIFALGFCCLSTGVLAQLASSPTINQSQPMQAVSLDAVIAPYVEEARKSYPTAKARFLQGLPSDQAFFVTVRLKDATGRSERVFLQVAEIRSTTVFGTIANKVVLVEGFKVGQRYSVDESDILDWMIAKPDGSEEGNFVGKFLDTYQP
jgi:uncharacterized protein YegJ (DUF2314 family)